MLGVVYSKFNEVRWYRNYIKLLNRSATKIQRAARRFLDKFRLAKHKRISKELKL
jgi:hypothetical protein